MGDAATERIRAIFKAAHATKTAGRRHPAEVTADRLLDHLDRWGDTADGELRDEISHVRHWLFGIAETADERRAEGT